MLFFDIIDNEWLVILGEDNIICLGTADKRVALNYLREYISKKLAEENSARK